MDQNDKDKPSQDYQYDHFTIDSIDIYCPLERVDANAPIKDAIAIMLKQRS